MNSSLPYKINWLDLSHVGYPDSIGIGALTGCKHRFIQRNMAEDLGVLKTNNVRHIILLCETVELQRFGVSIESFSDFEVHHYPCEYGLFPNIAELMEIIRRIFHIVETGEKCLIVSRDGLGRSCLVGATIILHTNDTLNYTDVYALMKRSVDRRAVQTVKWNFVISEMTLSPILRATAEQPSTDTFHDEFTHTTLETHDRTFNGINNSVHSIRDFWNVT